MKNSRFLTIAATLFLFSTITNAEVRTTPVQEIAAQSGMLVRTTYYKGCRIPVADLQEVEITGTMIPVTMMPALIDRGEITVVASLPEVEIAAADPRNSKVPVTYADGRPVATVFLPVVEISDALPMEHMVAVTFQNGEPVAVVSLDAIEISGTEEEITFTPAVSALASWDVTAQSNPALLVAHTGNDRYFLMSFEGAVSNATDDQVFIYRMISEVRGAISGGFRHLIQSLGAN